MKLAYLTNRYGMASYTFIMTEVEELRRRGHSVQTFSVRHPGRNERVDDAVAHAQETTEYFLDPDRLLVSLPKILLAAAKAALTRPRATASALVLAQRTSSAGLKARLKQIGFLVLACYLAERMKAHEVEHLHNHLGSSSATIAMLASIVAGIPFSLTIHGGQIFTEPRQWALGEKISRAAFTACISDFCRSQCMLFSPHAAWGRLKIVRCGLDERFLGGAASDVPENLSLVSVGRLSAEKGHLVLVQALHEVVSRGVDASLTLVGDGPLRAAIEEKIRALGLGSRVEITGLVGADEVRRRLCSARIFVLPSFTEGLPVSVMEAYAQRRPVIATNVGALSELVRPGETGWLVSPGSVEDLADALFSALRTSTERLAEMGARGGELVATRHRASTEIRRLEELLGEAIQNGRTSKASPVNERRAS